ncbi:hypothetical protein ACP8Y2_17150 [Herpetosiphon llansteffanensis]
MHPIWCAMTILAEPLLPETTRRVGSIVLLWHDLLEDTSADLLENTPQQVRQLVQEMTFDSFDHEMRELWQRSDLTKLFKLYDKTSQFFDAVWLRDARYAQLLNHTQQLTTFVQQTYGELNIVKLAQALAVPRSKR